MNSKVRPQKARRARKIAEADAVLAGRLPYAITIGTDKIQSEVGRTRMRAIAYPYDPTVPFRILRKGIAEISKVVRFFDGVDPQTRAHDCLASMLRSDEVQSTEYLGFLPENV